MVEDVKIITIDSKLSDSPASEEETLMDDESLVDEEEIGELDYVNLDSDSVEDVLGEEGDSEEMTAAPSTPTLTTTSAPYTSAVPATIAASATPITGAPSAPTLSATTAPYTTAVPATTAASGTITTTAQTTVPPTYA